VPPVSIGNQAGGNSDAEVIDEGYIGKGYQAEINVIKNIDYSKESVIKDEPGMHKSHYIFK
jgi:hypothetical protein